MPSAFLIDDSAFPMVLVRWQGENSAADVRDFFAAIDVLLTRGLEKNLRVAFIHDATNSGGADSEVRSAFAEGIKREPSKAHLVDVVVLSNAMQRGVITALTWVLPERMKGVGTAPTVAQAVDVAFDAYRKAHVPPPDRPKWG